MDHGSITAACVTCHNGSTAVGKPGKHIPSPTICDSCHTTNSFVPAHMDHGSFTTACFTCHNGSIEKGKPGDHPSSNNNCEECHTTNSWNPKK
jgi:hypothetical protein